MDAKYGTRQRKHDRYEQRTEHHGPKAAPTAHPP